MRRLRAALLLLVACAAPAPGPVRAVDPAVAQRAVEAVVARHPELVRLTVHAVPAGRTTSVIVACNLPEKLWMPSGPEDLAAMTSGRTTLLREGEHFDVTAPLHAADGTVFAATGITLALSLDAGEAEARRLARQVAAELAEALRAPQP